jgi:hypothetical protein
LESLCWGNPQIVQWAGGNIAERAGTLLATVALKPLGIDSEFDRFYLAPMTDHLSVAFLAAKT